MGIIPCRIHDIAEAKGIQLRVPRPARGMDRKQNGPENDDASDTDGAENSEKSKEEVAVERGVMKDVRIGDIQEGSEPVHKARRQLRTPFTEEQSGRVPHVREDIGTY